MRKNLVAGFLLAFGLAGCKTPVPIENVAALAPKAIEADADAKPIQFRKIAMKLNRGQKIGTLAGGLLCLPGHDLVYKGGRFTVDDQQFTEVFREELVKANYPIVGDPNALFDHPSEWKAEILVAGLVTDIKANICYPLAGWEDYTISKGEAMLTVEWQVFSRLDRRTVHKVTTKGTGIVSEGERDGSDTALYAAFAEATRGLLADETFHALVSRAQPAALPAAAAARPAVVLRRIRPHTGPITGRIAQIQAGVATVFAGQGHGSGFFVSTDGLLITNAHIVEQARFVKVKLSTGREILGEVLTSDPRRDVALIKTQESGFAALPIAAAELPAGSEIYAFGAPLFASLSNTVTRGIISAYRSMDGMRFIQGDVTVQGGNSGGPITDGSGNVVGITVRGIGQMNTGLNFFIPIDDALRSLGITLTDTGTARR